MLQCIVVADDLTGANATGVLLKKMNYDTYTVMNTERLELALLDTGDCVIYPTDSRSISAKAAYNRVYNVTKLLEGPAVKVYGKRIDSTLRGNLGSETDGMLDALGEDYTAIAAPCLPASGRVLAGGCLLVNGQFLHKTEAAIDPKNPICTPSAQAAFQAGSKYPVAQVTVNEMLKGKEYIIRKIKTLRAEGNRTIIFDCITQEDLDFIADAVIAAKIKFIAVDPGAFTATVARKIIVPREKTSPSKILAVVGSVNPVTKKQMEELWLSQHTQNVFVRTRRILESDSEREQEIARVTEEIIRSQEDCPVFTVTGDGMMPENRIDFSFYIEKLGCSHDQISTMINQAFAEIAYRIFHQDENFRGLYTSGGDITVAVCEKFETAGLCLEDEVLPLAAYGKLLKGRFDGMHIVTKGGMAGDKDAINKCITYLKQKLYI